MPHAGNLHVGKVLGACWGFGGALGQPEVSWGRLGIRGEAGMGGGGGEGEPGV